MKERRFSQLVVPVSVIMIIIMMVVPLPTAILDLLIAANMTSALLIVLIAMYVQRPLDFSVFPSLLLVATLFRLALNVSATRLVLLHGFAGKVIDAFGHFVVGGSLVVGLVIFLILIVIQFVVITNGAGRVAEVGARFTLDAMPGKQMAIDADLNAGLINEHEARHRRADVAAEADFYGAMDGASKFVKGDAIAAIVITLINLIGGFAIGMLQRGLSPAESIRAYSLLSVGDGLVSQIPALLLSVATGLIVTRATTEEDMGTAVARQFGAQRSALRIGGSSMLALSLVPGLPKLPFLAMGAMVLVTAQRLPKVVDPAGAESVVDESPAPDSTESLLDEMRVDPLELALAPNLLDLVDFSGGDLLDRVRALRRKIALDIGVVMPPVRTRDDLTLPLSTYAIRISGIEVARGEAPPGTVLAIGDDLDSLPGRAGQEPVFGLEGKWVPAELRHHAEMTGSTVVDRASVLITHLAEVVRANASRLLGRQDVRALTEMVRRTHPVVVEELTPALLTLGEVQRVLHGLLDEAVPIRDLVRIFEALSLAAKAGVDSDRTIEVVRAALGPAVAAPYVVNGVLPVLTLEPRFEQSLLESLVPGDAGYRLNVDSGRAEALVETAVRVVDEVEQHGHTPVLLCSPQLRFPLRRLLTLAIPRLPVLSYPEISGCTARIESMGVVTGAYAIAA